MAGQQLNSTAAAALALAGVHVMPGLSLKPVVSTRLRQYSHLALSNIRPGVVGGPGNRSSYVVNELAKRGTQVVCPYRSLEEKAMTLKQMGDLGQVRAGLAAQR
ncbi:hypothetical protein COO60DRAFT_1682144 [Scenedesmus sp. NREL 46B-D3]|nr:hypothetical protein COO60DRAFT_1682144 [Scenedesmus sp. NREL 46B-D3]